MTERTEKDAPEPARELGGLARVALFGILAGILLFAIAAVAGPTIEGFGWSTRDGRPLEIDMTFRPLTRRDANAAIDVELAEGEGAVILIVGTGLTGSDTTTASCSARDEDGAIDLTGRPNVALIARSDGPPLFRSGEEIIFDRAIRPGTARRVEVRCDMEDSGIRGVAVVPTDQLVFPEEAAWVVIAEWSGGGLAAISAALLAIAMWLAHRR
jgi:hypothetical protein